MSCTIIAIVEKRKQYYQVISHWYEISYRLLQTSRTFVFFSVDVFLSIETGDFDTSYYCFVCIAQ